MRSGRDTHLFMCYNHVDGFAEGWCSLMEQVREESVGTITLSITLILLGSALLMENVFGNPILRQGMQRFWPIIIILFGLELLWRTHQAGSSDEPFRVRVDFLSAFLLVAIIVALHIPSGVCRFIPPRMRFFR